jgi:hypothetical protein
MPVEVGVPYVAVGAAGHSEAGQVRCLGLTLAVALVLGRGVVPRSTCAAVVVGVVVVPLAKVWAVCKRVDRSSHCCRVGWCTGVCLERGGSKPAASCASHRE